MITIYFRFFIFLLVGLFFKECNVDEQQLLLPQITELYYTIFG